MGTNRRYPSRVTLEREQRREQGEHAAPRPEPISLTDAELDKAHTRVTEAHEPIPVRAWVRFPERPVHANGRAVAWTNRAVLIEWETPDGRTVRAWVWASAVERVDPPVRP